jgi:hypothetical protein
VEGTIEADSIAIILFVVVTNFHGVLHSLGPGIGKEGGAEAKLRGELHELVMKVRGRGNLNFLRVLSPGADEITPRVAVRINRLELGSQAYQLRVVVAQS